MKSSSFSLYEQSLTNETVTITYKPIATVSTYSYKIYKDGNLFDEVNVTNGVASNIILEESGDYSITVELVLKNGTVKKEESGHYLLDVDSPYILGKDSYITLYSLKKGQTFAIATLKRYVTVRDKQDGDLFDSLSCDFDSVDFTQLGVHKLACTVTDKAGNVGEKELLLKLEKNREMELNIMIGILSIFIFLLVIFYLRFQRSVRLERKFMPYAIEPLKDKKISIFDTLSDRMYQLILLVNKAFDKSVFVSKYAKKYEKYLPLYKHFNQTMDFVSSKILAGISLVLVSIIGNILHYHFMSIYELFIPFLVGFFLPDILYFIRYKLYRNTIENDLLQAIIIMNNAFKSGRSITQAIELVTKELDGPIGVEFKKMHMEISFGLGIEEVFERFSKRVKLEEVTYLTASLSILNKTGGNIIKVFSSIEKTLFNKKKLKLELRSLTGSSKIIVYVLFAVPLLFILFISLVSPGYFTPFYTTPIGMILLCIMVLIYVLYIWFVRKIMKVRM